MPDIEAVSGKGVLYARPHDHGTVEIHWSVLDSVKDTWAEVAIVRSVYGAPSTVMDGVTIFRGLEADLFPTGIPTNSAGNYLIPAVYDINLNPGRWYYYSLFYRISEVEWKRGMSASTPLPRDYHHSEHLWNNIPPYYQLTDGQYRNYLHQFLDVFGFELDTTREFIEQWQELYHIDATPMRLLRHLGANFDVPYESGLGDIRYRSLMANIGHLYDTRGTITCLEQVIEAASKYECDITGGANLMPLPDDSDFFTGTGNWAGLHPAADENRIADPDDVPPYGAVSIAPATDVVLGINALGLPASPPNSGRGTMWMKTTDVTETQGVLLTCGCGITTEALDVVVKADREVLPLFGGVVVEPGVTYGFTVQLKMAQPSQVSVKLLWFGAGGQPTDLVRVNSSAAVTPTPTAEEPWDIYTVEGAAPADAVYLVPCVYFLPPRIAGSGPWSPTADLAGALVWRIS